MKIKQQRTLHWYIHQHLTDYCDEYSNMVFPPAFSRDHHMEPSVMYYGRYKTWETVDTELKTYMACSHIGEEIPVCAGTVEGEGNEVEETITATAMETETQPSTESRSDANGDTAAASEALEMSQQSKKDESEIIDDDSPEIVEIVSQMPTQTDEQMDERPVKESPWNQALGRTGDVYSPKQSCYRKPGGYSASPDVFNQYLKPHRELTDKQRHHFWDLVGKVEDVHGSSISVISQQVAKVWKRRHIRMIQTEDDVGLGGLIYSDHVMKLLKKKGYQMLEGNV